MIGRDANVFLFIESPHLKGVDKMSSVGNAIVDPEGQGADGLDFLANLSFTNFAPAIGCILGDEMADSQYRFFARPDLPLNIGQGIFYLNANLTDVPGSRFTQFNRSPQLGPIPYEQNANFIELAIPLSALGSLRPGETIKIGAVVGRGGYDTNKTVRARELDTSFLGRNLRGFGMSPVVLEGIPVTLAPDPDPGSIHLEFAKLSAPGKFQLIWNSTPGKLYSVQIAPAAKGPFNDLIAPNLPIRAGPNDYDLTCELLLPTPLPKAQFVRIKLLE